MSIDRAKRSVRRWLRQAELRAESAIVSYPGALSLVKKLATQFLPTPILFWLKERYYTRTVPKFWEADIEPIQCFLKPGDYALDIGANIGWYSLVLARLVGHTGRVWAIEPIPETFRLLSAVVRKLALTNVELVNCALSDQNGSAVMEIPLNHYGGPNFYMARIVSRTVSEPSLTKFEVPLRSLDSIIPVRLANAVTFVKCDVEGHELAVIKGASRFFENTRPALMLEVAGTAQMQDATTNELFSILRGYGYTPYLFNGKNLKKRMPGDWCLNYFFLQPSHLKQAAHLLSS
jgi:FkbM family methyltransferase